MPNLKFAAASALLAGLFATSAGASDFADACIAAAQEAGKSADAAQGICECMESEAQSEEVLAELTAAASLPPGERGDGLSSEAEAVRNACRPA